MSRNKFAIILLLTTIFMGVMIFISNDSNLTTEKYRVDFSYTYVSKEEIQNYKENWVDGFDWTKVDFGTIRLEKADERYAILKIHLGAQLDKQKTLYLRLRNKSYEVYIDKVLIKRNGEVASDKFFRTMDNYAEVKIPFTSSEGKDIYILLEAPTTRDITNIDEVEVVLSNDFFNANSIFDVIVTFFIVVAIAISALASLSLYWVRFNFSGKFYKAIFPVWLFLGGILIDTPYIQLNYTSKYSWLTNVSVAMVIISMFMVTYGVKKVTRTKISKILVKSAIAFLWIFTINMIIFIMNGTINWEFVKYALEKIVLIMVLPFLVFLYLQIKYLDHVFRVPIKLFLSSITAFISLTFIIYSLNEYLTISIVIYYIITFSVIAIMVLSSFIINTIYANLFLELESISNENDIHQNLGISDMEADTKTKENSEEQIYNLCVEYVTNLIGGDVKATSITLSLSQDDELDVIFQKNSFGKKPLTEQEVRYYYSVYEHIFVKENTNVLQNGNTIYLGFKLEKLHYFMVIHTREKVGSLKIKALKTYATGIKNNAQNYVITRYIEQARNEVLRSFGRTIETRVGSNNVIGVTDKFVAFIAKVMGKSEEEIQILKSASYLKNIGSIVMHENELNDYKNMNENEIINTYKRADFGYDILKKFNDKVLSKAAKMAKYQFESYDGSGYLGLKGDQIPDEGKIAKLSMVMTASLRYIYDHKDLDIFIQIIAFVEEYNINEISTIIFDKCKESQNIFDEIVLENREEFLEKIKEIKLKDENYLY